MLNKIEKDKSIIISPPIHNSYYPENMFVIPITLNNLCPYPKKFSDATVETKMVINFISSVIHSIFTNSATSNDKLQLFIESVVSEESNSSNMDDKITLCISQTEQSISENCTDSQFKWNRPEYRPYSRKGFFIRGQMVRRYRLWVFFSDDIKELFDKHIKNVLDTNGKIASYVANARRTTTSPQGVPLITDKIRLFETVQKTIYPDVTDFISDDRRPNYDTICLTKLFSVKHEFRMSNDNIKDYLYGEKSLQWRFKKPFNVCKLETSQIKLDSILDLYLPDYQANIVGIEYYILFSLMDELSKSIVATVPQTDNNVYSSENDNPADDYEELGVFSDIVHQAIDSIKNTPLTLKTMVENYLVDRITYISLSLSSNVSDVGRSVTKFLHNTMFTFHHDRASNNNTMPIYDRSLGIFSNFMIWFTNMCEQYLVLSTSHWSFCKCYFGTLDSFRVDYYSLHFNAFMVGEHMSGKSFIFQKLKEMTFAGNIVEFSQWSKNALTTTSKIHDLVIVFHEAPSELFCTSTNGRTRPTEPWLGIVKDMLTRNTVGYYYNAGIDSETGKRISVTLEKAVYLCLMFVTNESPKNVEPALISRFLQDFATTGSRYSKSPSNLNASFKQFMTEVDKMIHKYFKTFSAHLRVKVFLVFKMIHTQILPKIKCFVTDYILTELDKCLFNHNMKTIDDRTRTRILIFVVIFTIINGLIHLYELENSKYAKVPFNIKQLVDMKPFMEDSEEIAVFTIGFLTRSIYDPIEKIILIILGNIHRNLVLNVQMKAFKTTGSVNTNTNININGNGNGNRRSSFNIVSELNESDVDGYDPNWLYFPMNKNILIKEICNNYPTGLAGKPPETQVAIILDNLAERHMWVNTYKFVHTSMYQPRIQKVDRLRETKKGNIDFRDYATFIHTSLLYKDTCDPEDLHQKFVDFKKTLIADNINPIKDFVADIIGYNSSSKRHMLYGEIESYKYPYVYSMIKVVPDKNKELILSNNWFSGVRINTSDTSITKAFDVNLDTCARYELVRTLYPDRKYPPIMEVDSLKHLIETSSDDIEKIILSMDPTRIDTQTYRKISENKFMGLQYGEDSIHNEKLVNIILMLHDDSKNISLINRYNSLESMKEEDFNKIFTFIQKIDESITDEEICEALILFYNTHTLKKKKNII